MLARSFSGLETCFANRNNVHMITPTAHHDHIIYEIFCIILWHIDRLLGNNRETNKTTTFVRQLPSRNNGSTVGNGVFYVILSEAISRDQPGSFQLL
jgi:hypothetical protein